VLPGWNATPVTGPAWAMTCERIFASALFQRNRRESAVPPATSLASGDRAALLTAAAGPANARTCAPLANVESRTVLSALAESTEALSAAREICVTASPCGAAKGRAATGGTCQNFSVPSAPPVYAALLAGARTTLVTLPV